MANGQVDAAAETMRGLTWAESRLGGHAWYRYYLAGDYQHAIYAWQTVLLLNPTNDSAAYWLTQVGGQPIP